MGMYVQFIVSRVSYSLTPWWHIYLQWVCKCLPDGKEQLEKIHVHMGSHEEFLLSQQTVLYVTGHMLDFINSVQIAMQSSIYFVVPVFVVEYLNKKMVYEGHPHLAFLSHLE